MKKLFKYAKEYRKECVFAPLFKLFEAMLELFVPLVVKSMIDNGIYKGDKGYIIQMCVLMLALGIAGLLSSITAQYFAAVASVGITSKMRHTLFAHLQKLSFSSLDRIGKSTMITRLTNDMNQIQNGINMTLRLLLRSPLVVFGAMIMAFTIDIRSAIIFAAAIAILIAIVMGIMIITIPLYKKSGHDLDLVTETVRENLTGVRVIRAFCREDAERNKFKRRNDILTSSQNFVGRIASLMNPLTYVIINAAIVLLLYTGALQIKSGVLTQGAIIALYNYMSQILVELIKMASLIITINRSIACAGRVSAALDIPQGMENKPHDTVKAENGYAVEFQNVSMKYEGGGDTVLENISFRVKRGETVGIIGGTGSGKTSLVNLIPRFYDVSGGHVIVNGKDVRDIDLSELRQIAGTVMQRSVLFRGTLRDNLKWGCPGASDEELISALSIAQANFTEEKGGLDMMIEQGGRNLSGGQRQRISIARTLASKPEILILDDSSSALDYATDAALRSSLKKLDGSVTIFIVSQRTSSIRHADKIIVLDDGMAVGIGTHDELLESCPVYKEIYNSQFKKESSPGKISNNLSGGRVPD